MQGTNWSLSEDLLPWAVACVGAVVLLSWLLLLLELRRGGRRIVPTFVSGVVGVALLAAAVLRPVVVSTRGQIAGAPVTVLVDQSRRLLLPAGDGTRRDRALRAVEGLAKEFDDARVEVLGFGDGPLEPLGTKKEEGAGAELSTYSDLVEALDQVAQRRGERPRAVVVVSDGRLTRPSPEFEPSALQGLLGATPIHTISVGEETPKDASVRRVGSAATAVAHQSFALEVEVGCDERLDCESIPVVVRELLAGEPPAVLATGVARPAQGQGTIELDVTLERAGPRIVEVSIQAPEGDEIPANDTRILTFNVARDRIRILHVAGRPTYDVRALRMFLKSDESIDLVAFFILRTLQDRTEVSDESELALIPFPVEELFTEHLPSFDAVVLQDIDAVEYKLRRHFRALNAYVRGGGGIIMVGGPAAFIGGGYADTLLEEVLPVELDASAPPYDRAKFVPRYTEAGRDAPVLGELQQLLGQRMVEMVGSNTLGPPRQGAVVLWEHPSRLAANIPGAAAMPVLALAEVGDGRTIALSVDGTHSLTFSDLGVETAGRAYGALWEGLLGWLMRDPRYEAGRMDLEAPCIAGEDATLKLLPLPGAEGEVELELSRLGPTPEGKSDFPKKLGQSRRVGRDIFFELGALPAGGYSARATVGSAPPTRFVFPCEQAGVAWSDTRPDPARLRAIARATSGVATTYDALETIPEPEVTMVAAERDAAPLLPAWAWTAMAAFAMAVHWILRRRSGLA